MASPSMLTFMAKIPLPMFGSAAAAYQWSRYMARLVPPAAPWLLPGLVGATWFVWPAVDQEWKVSMGLMKDPNPPPPEEEPKPIKLDADAVAAVATVGKPTGEDEAFKALSAQVKSGDYSSMEADWEKFTEKAIIPGEGDDDDDDDDEDDDDDDEDEDDDDDDDE
eukprot:CAMPEP_0194035438 /NCGR_PEP_ID=MMETSP0009_2-20130614/7863_1 /TAXON_ID=210454 /ORGANISM="Grammatophora oceanica, Strain CCMP 410" /LENGTH=164 /DNA_ID=CAMNT_0038676787 /DNA_START=90 /DNA_END=584 /DNA_ORIENTATION=-